MGLSIAQLRINSYFCFNMHHFIVSMNKLAMAKEFEISDVRDFAFNMSVGYDLEGIKTEKIDNYIEGLKYAANTEIWKESIAFLKENSF